MEAAFPAEARRGGRQQALGRARQRAPSEESVWPWSVPGEAHWKLGRGDGGPHGPPGLRVMPRVH